MNEHPYVAYRVDGEQDDAISSAVARIMEARPTFKVGDRVRVTGAIAECRQDWGRYSTSNGPGHWRDDTGLTGWISSIKIDDEFNHPIVVEMDRRDLGFTALYMNATELEPLDA